MKTLQMTTTPQLQEEHGGFSIALLCWQCGASLGAITSAPKTGSGMRLCDNCNVATECRDGLWLSLAPQRAQHFSHFISDYEFIRAAEGRGSTDDDYYLGLPYEDLSGNNSDQWAIRACTFLNIQRNIISPLAKVRSRPLSILDLGAGNGWMSYRLAQLGHFPVAVDLLTNNQDGLGAAIHFSRNLQSLFPRVQAELDHLPFVSSTFDLTIFNASFHYSENYERTLAEALRCTRAGGAVLIADTPWYADEESGKRMIEEKHARFAAQYGFPSDSISSLEYLTPSRLQQLRAGFDATWDTFKPFYGIRWSLRGLRAKLNNRRSPSQFRIYAAWVNR